MAESRVFTTCNSNIIRQASLTLYAVSGNFDLLLVITNCYSITWFNYLTYFTCQLVTEKTYTP